LLSSREKEHAARKSQASDKPTPRKKRAALTLLQSGLLEEEKGRQNDDFSSSYSEKIIAHGGRNLPFLLRGISPACRID
jgi:hypothetical protein